MTHRVLEGFESLLEDDHDVVQEMWVVDQVTKSEFFRQKVDEYGLLEVAYAIERVQGELLAWDREALAISARSWNKVIHRGIKPVRVFCHPHVLRTIPRAIGYYQKLAMVSLKSMRHVGFDVVRYENGTNRLPLSNERARNLTCHLNTLISRLIEAEDDVRERRFDLWRGMTAGSTAQGSWQNRKGDIAEALVAGLLREHLYDQQLAQFLSRKATQHLHDGRVVEYASEPDIAIYAPEGHILGAVEIKGGIDPAGILERVGAAIKSLSRVKQENPKAITILVMYRASITDQSIADLTAHRHEIDHWFTIEDLLNKESSRQRLFSLLNV